MQKPESERDFKSPLSPFENGRTEEEFEEIAHYRAEISRLQQALEEKTQEVHQLMQWIQSLQQDILAVYNSITWQIGNLVTRIVLKLQRRSVGPTARDHINKILLQFESWKVNYFQNRSQIVHSSHYKAWHDTREYASWIKQYDTLTATSSVAMQKSCEQWSYQPLFSVLMVICDDDLQNNASAIESIQRQLYSQWELCIAGSPAIAAQLTAQNPQIKFIICEESLALCLNSVLQSATGDFIAIMGAQDCLPVHAFYKIAETLQNHPDLDLIYTDSDELDDKGQRCNPYFKSDWNPDLFYSQNYLKNLTLYRRSIAQRLGSFAQVACEDYDFTLRFLEQTQRIAHIPHILYHQRKPSIIDSTAASHALTAHFQRLQQPVEVVAAPGGHTRVIYPLPPSLPLVSVIIPTRDKLSLLRTTVEGVLQHTDYDNLELIILDNGSVEPETLNYLQHLSIDPRITVIRHTAPFNYAQLNNIGVAQARGELLAFLNNDLEVITHHWLKEMVSHALRPEIGAVGAKLYYANDTIQHAGVIVGLGGMAGHGFKYLFRESPGYHWRPLLIQNYSAVTAACLVMRHQVFKEVGPFEERFLAVAFNDVDLCLRIREKGYRIVWTPYAELYHFESVSRGADDTFAKFLRLQRELKYMRSRWEKVLANDPYYNPNLTIEYEDFALAYPPRLKSYE